MTSRGPIEIAVTRGGVPESLHHVHAVVSGPDGIATHVFGDAGRPTFPRSAIKGLQALPLVESGAARRYGVSARELALACSSHEGEAMHVDAVAAWLRRIGLDDADLACGPQWPRRRADELALACGGGTPVRMHNNCSGKHTGMLATALHCGESTAGYEHREHAVQRRVFDAFSDMLDMDVGALPFGIDGCSAPNPRLPLDRIAAAAARLAEASAERLGPTRAEACRTLLAAMVAHPDMVGGTDRVDTDLIRASQGRIVTKTGAEGVYVGYLPERGIGFALKAADGAARASAAGLWHILEMLGLLDNGVRALLKPHCLPVIRNWDGLETGDVEIV